MDLFAVIADLLSDLAPSVWRRLRRRRKAVKGSQP